MSNNYVQKRPLSLKEIPKYPLFQIPLIALIICLIIAPLGGFWGIGKPEVAVAIALDLSSSTHGYILDQEIKAINAYVDYNQTKLKKPNLVQVWGFGGSIKPLTGDFTSDSEIIKQQLQQTLNQSNWEKRINSGSTNLNLAITTTTAALAKNPQVCRELLVVTDGKADLHQKIVREASLAGVKINAVIIGGDSLQLKAATEKTGGIYLTETVENLENLFTQQIFQKFNTNLPWVIFWLGCAWIAWMWMLCLPLNRLFFQRFLGFNWHRASQLSIAHAYFHTALTPIIIWHLGAAVPIISSCN